MRIWGSLIMAAALCACGPKPVEATKEAAPADAPAAGIVLHLTFSEAAKAKIAEVQEKVTVSAMYHGDPKPGLPPERQDDMGVSLGLEEVEVDGVDGDVTLKAVPDPAKLGDIAGPPQVTVNVFTSRKTQENNLLDCSLVFGPIAETDGETVTCKLIYGEPS